MDLNLDGKRALVTGGTAGIGLAIAEILAAEGAHVIITGRSRQTLDKALLEIQQESNGKGHAEGVLADLGTRSGADTLLAQIPDVDILVNNLGIYESKPFADITDDDWLHIFEVNVLSGVRTARVYLPKMLARNSGRVIFISSESALLIPPTMIHYSVTKTAQLAIARGLAETTRGTAVTVNSVQPGPTMSPGVVEFIKSISPNPNAPFHEMETAFFEKHRSTSLLQRLIDPKEVASLVAYLASPLSAATNGAALRVEGGLITAIA